MRARLRDQQLIGIAGAVPGMVCVAGVLEYAPRLFASVALPAASAGERLAFVAHWLVLPAATLLVGVLFAARRGFDADAIEGTRAPASRSLEINLRYNQNTLEQLVLAASAWAALALTLPQERLVVVPAMAVLFVAGRATFWIGYLVHPMGRTFGMVLTVLPTLGAFAWLLWRLVR
jgi:MAPEG family protein